MKIKIKPFTGTWVIVELGAWDQEYVNMEVSGYWILHVQEKWHGTFSFRTGPGRDGLLYGYELKWKEAKVKIPTQWRRAYPDSSFEVINTTNFENWVG